MLQKVSLHEIASNFYVYVHPDKSNNRITVYPFERTIGGWGHSVRRQSSIFTAAAKVIPSLIPDRPCTRQTSTKPRSLYP